MICPGTNNTAPAGEGRGLPTDIKDKTYMFINYAHRGASEYAPENTFSAFYLALLQGADGIETDVRRTKDGRLLLFHDATLTQCCGREGRISDYTWDELRSFTVRGGAQARIREDRLVLFEDFLRHFAFRDLKFAIEMKDRHLTSDVLALCRHYEVVDKSIFSSFDRGDLEAFRALGSDLHLGYLTRSCDEETLDFMRRLKIKQLCLKSSALTAKLVKEVQAEGIEVRAWHVPDEKTMLHVINCGVAGGMTINFPDVLSRYLLTHGKK